MGNQIIKGLVIIIMFLFVLANTRADVMNLNEFMPTKMEDASVTDLSDVEFQTSAHYQDDEEFILFRPNIRWGAIKRVQFEAYSDHISGPHRRERGNGQTVLGAQWNFNDQDDWVPSLALSPQFTFPTGESIDGIDPSLRINLTYTLVGTLDDPLGQFHMNYKWDHNSSRKRNEEKVGELFVFGYSHRIGTNSSLMADFLHEKDKFRGDSKNEVEVGWLHDFARQFAIGIGGGYDVKEGYFSSTLAIQKTF